MRPLSLWARVAAIALHCSLIIGLMAVSRSQLGHLFALLLFLPLPGLLQGNPRTYGWASMLLVFYCGGLLANVYDNPGPRGPMLLLSLMAALEFVALALFVRLRGREQQARAARRS